MARLIFDIETIGEDFDSLDETTKNYLTSWLKKESEDEAQYQKSLEDLKNHLGFSPLTGEVIVIGVLDDEKNSGVVYFQAPGEKIGEFSEAEFKFKQMTEAEMLKNFWEGIKSYNEFVSFNGRSFDVPFLMVRSAVHKIRPSKNLISHRYLDSQKADAIHIDLMDQLSFYGALRKKGSLHLWTRIFNIKSPKTEGITGDDVSRLFKEKKYIEIARYNTLDLKATKALFDYWQTYLKF